MANIFKLLSNNKEDYAVITGVSSAVLDKGNIVRANSLVSGQIDKYTLEQPATATLTEDEAFYGIVVPQEVYKDSLGNRPGFVTDPTAITFPIGTPLDVVRVAKGQRILISNTGYDGTGVVGQYLIPQNGSFKPVASSTITGIGFKFVIESITYKYAVGNDFVTCTIARRI